MTEKILGPLKWREFTLEKICDVNHGHQHNYDHVTVVNRGRIKVLYKLTADGPEQESREFGAGEKVLIKANVFHTIKALAADTQYDCVFTHRDFNGEVVQHYNGNERAYI